MPAELSLTFRDATHVSVSFEGDTSQPHPFTDPFTPQIHEDIRWYIETYAAHSLGDPDDQRAARIRSQLPGWGSALFKAVLAQDDALRLFNAFQDTHDSRLLTIAAQHPAIHGLPWELLHDPSGGAGSGSYLFQQHPSISIRRRLTGTTGERNTQRPEPKTQLHLLFIVSRPDDLSFIDPRADPAAVLDALVAAAPGRVTTEFLRPPTLMALTRRLEDKDLPAVDIIHFDGHGVFDFDGEIARRLATPDSTATQPQENKGYLCFETADHRSHYVAADDLAEVLAVKPVSLLILSACQSGAISQDDPANPDARPMGGIAARLIGSGIPSVLAMTHNVLVPTTRQLFGQFYGSLARHEGIGAALDHARSHLHLHPFKYYVQRGPQRSALHLEDWFLPALFQQGQDIVLLAPAKANPSSPSTATVTRSNLPERPEAGFFGRRHELWLIERWFASPTQRISITGFGGQGKTALAQEAGRWLLSTGMFQAVVFVDYDRDRSADAAQAARNELGSVLGHSFTSDAEITAALTSTATLIILDNLEILSPTSRLALLSASLPWSQAGRSRVLITGRQPDAQHPGYPSSGSLVHRTLSLDGLGNGRRPDDALEWFAQLQILPPAPQQPSPDRQALIELFTQVAYHPLSLRVLAAQLKTRNIASVGTGLATLLASAEVQEHSHKNEDTPAGLLASLLLSLHQLNPSDQALVNRLGVFQGGAFEDDILAITGLGGANSPHLHYSQLLAAAEAEDFERILQLQGSKLPTDPSELEAMIGHLRHQLVAGVPKLREDLAAQAATSDDAWPRLRQQLVSVALIIPEAVAKVSPPFLRFHPTLAPLLASRLSRDECQSLVTSLRRHYHAVANYLYKADIQAPHEARAIARRDLPNLLHACYAALEAGEADAVTFVDRLNKFLAHFGLHQESQDLLGKAQAAEGTIGSDSWYLFQMNEGERLRARGNAPAAQVLFEGVLQQLHPTPSWRRAQALGCIGRCLRMSGRPDLAAELQNKALAVLAVLDATDSVKRQRVLRLTDLADNLQQMGEYAAARRAYEQGLELAKELNDLPCQAAGSFQLGTLAMLEGNLTEAKNYLSDALAHFQHLEEPDHEASVWHQLGNAFHQVRHWDEAERHYREAARIKEQQGNLTSAAQTWNNLAVVAEKAGKPEAAEHWYRKVLQHLEAPFERVSALSNLADLLCSQSIHLTDARAMADEALTICLTLDPGAAEIWKTNNILAHIADAEALQCTEPAEHSRWQAEARSQRAASRASRRAYPGTRTQLKRHAPVILAAALACTGHAGAPSALDQHQAAMRRGVSGWIALAAAIDQLLAGQRDADRLCADLDYDPAMIIEAILAGIADPSTLEFWTEAEE